MDGRGEAFLQSAWKQPSGGDRNESRPAASIHSTSVSSRAAWEAGPGVQESWVQVLVLALTQQVALGKLLHLPKHLSLVCNMGATDASARELL